MIKRLHKRVHIYRSWTNIRHIRPRPIAYSRCSAERWVI